MKKLFIISSFVLLFGLGISGAHAADTGFVALAPIPGLTKGVIANPTGLANFFNNLYKYLVGLAAALAVIQIIWAGIEIAANRDNVGTLLDEKGKIYNAIFGLLLVLSPVLVFSIINPSILNLSLNLQPLNTAPQQIKTGPKQLDLISSNVCDSRMFSLLKCDPQTEVCAINPNTGNPGCFPKDQAKNYVDYSTHYPDAVTCKEKTFCPYACTAFTLAIPTEYLCSKKDPATQN